MNYQTNQQLSEVLQEACARNHTNPGVPDMDQSDWAIVFAVLSERIQNSFSEAPVWYNHESATAWQAAIDSVSQYFHDQSESLRIH